MKLKMYAVRDHKTAQFANPMFVVTDGHAIRSFADAVNQDDKENLLHRHPADFALFTLGDYDTETGIITPTQPTQLVTAEQVKTAK
jgi:hypothetical protein